MAQEPLVEWTKKGLFCRQAGIYVDPSRKVDRAIITHGHSDHARRGCSHYLAARVGEQILKTRLGKKATIQSVEFGESFEMNGVRITLHPAGHVRGSAQVRLERAGEVWVISGDYKLSSDPTCAPFELLRCHTFITESTFGLPIYRWSNTDAIFNAINHWWSRNREHKTASIILGYSLGKTQRLLMGLDTSIGPVFAHKTIREMNAVYRASGVDLPLTKPLEGEYDAQEWSQGMILTPPTAMKDGMLEHVGPSSTAIASGWARVGRMSKGRAGRGFVLSDHVDWPGIVATCKATEAERIMVHHGMAGNVARYLLENGHNAIALTKENAVEA